MTTDPSEKPRIHHLPVARPAPSPFPSVEAYATLEAELAESRARFSNLIEGSLQGILIHKQMTPLFVNQAYADIFGYTRAEIFNMPNILPLFAPDERARLLGLMKDRLQGRAVPVQFEFKGMRKDGSLIWLDKRVLVTEWSGEPAIQMTVFEITERKKAEQRLRDSEDRYRILYAKSRKAQEVYQSLLHSSADPIVIYDLTGHVTYISPAFTSLFGWTMDELQGRRIPFVPESETERTEDTIRDLLGEGQPVRGYETRRLTKSGRILDVSLSASRYGDDQGDPAGILVVIHDLTEKNEMEERLFQANKLEAIGRLAGGIAHDFNNILGAIMGYAELARLDAAGNPDISDHLKQVLRASNRARELVKQILAFSRNGTQNKKPIKLATVVDETLDLLRATLPISIDVRLQMSAPRDVISADSTQMHQIIMNLCTNAAQAMSSGGGTLTVALSHYHQPPKNGPPNPDLHPGPHARLRVQDTGLGMAPDVCERIFEPFFTTRGTGQGTGMGLAVVHGIVTSHGGSIVVKSAPDRGTTIDVFFPCIDSAVTGPEPFDIPRATKNERILFVDDDPIQADLGRKLLIQLGYRVTAATTGTEALDRFKADPNAFSVVVADMAMPAMTDDKLVKTLLGIRPDTPIIISTGFANRFPVEQAQQLGIQGYLMKPLELSRLAKMIRSALDS